MQGFEAASDYAGKFELFREFFAENEKLDFDKLQEEDHGLICTHIHTCTVVCKSTVSMTATV